MISGERFSEYRVMWVVVFFDLPVDTKKARREAALFRKNLLRDGFTMMQFSIYVRHCASSENAAVHTKRVKNLLPEYGNVVIFTLTDKQFAQMEVFSSKQQKENKSYGVQLELF
ncbi:MAG: CRISPR-associated endonuclease Cas2 [Bacteroidaceae bacterium]|nr:CRISPR-associated endonuclease Cas2 [Bacteroidaceae bacterium]